MTERKSFIARMSQEAVQIGPRVVARTMLDGAGISLVMAFNMTNDPAKPWRFPAETQAKAARLFQEIIVLFERGGFEESRAPAAQADSGFQRFMRRAAEGGT
jgi:hypothetical protein